MLSCGTGCRGAASGPRAGLASAGEEPGTRELDARVMVHGVASASWPGSATICEYNSHIARIIEQYLVAKHDELGHARWRPLLPERIACTRPMINSVSYNIKINARLTSSYKSHSELVHVALVEGHEGLPYRGNAEEEQDGGCGGGRKEEEEHGVWDAYAAAPPAGRVWSWITAS